ncbi:DEAD/DEAH box helicase [Halobaculum sp. MBLA0143]|uniref:DEAD/DEAH box helicase n=1 Tax=Halobaculum sp. MBLA0143 TaxID=3079933 RepID=UPI00352590A6
MTDDDATDLSLDELYDTVEAAGSPVVTATTVARETGRSQATATEALDELAADGDVARVETDADPVVYYPQSWGDLADRERLVVFPDRREIVADRPTQYTRASLAQFAHLVDSTRTEPGTRGYLYEIRPEDVWAAPFDELDALLDRVRSVLPRQVPDLESWIGEQWKRANQFVLDTHEDGYVVLRADREELMGNVARQKLADDHLRAAISDTESWVNEAAVGAIKRTLYDAGYPVRDDRNLESGEPLTVELETELRDYQREWVDRFLERQSGVLTAPPGSGKTIAAIGVLSEVGGETLILVPSRELAGQWHDELLAHTDLDDDQVGEYHGGRKEERPVTITTYQTAGMDRHRSLFDSREWGLLIFDECHRLPSDVFRRTADLQSRHRLGTTASAVREDDREEEIFTLIGPPLGTDWGALFDAGHVVEPEVEIRYVPWDETAETEFAAADRREQRQIAATNPAKVGAVRRLREAHPDARTLVFVDYLDQGRDLEASLGVPFVSGETRHRERERLFEQFRQGELEALIVSRIADEGLDLPNAELAIVASGLGGSRRQGTQRAGRTMRPSGSALVYVLATRGTTEEEFARRRMQHLSEKGIRVRERTVE